MKRSEIKNLLIETLINKWDIPFGQYEGTYTENTQEFAEDILRTIEEVGMLPPNRAIVDGKFNQQKFNEIVNTGISCNQWESEDEKK